MVLLRPGRRQCSSGLVPPRRDWIPQPRGGGMKSFQVNLDGPRHALHKKSLWCSSLYIYICYAMLCYVMLWFVMLCYGLLCYVMVCFVLLCLYVCMYVCMYVCRHVFFWIIFGPSPEGKRNTKTCADTNSGGLRRSWSFHVMPHNWP